MPEGQTTAGVVEPLDLRTPSRTETDSPACGGVFFAPRPRVLRQVHDRSLPPDHGAFVAADPSTGRVIVIAPTRAACETIEIALGLHLYHGAWSSIRTLGYAKSTPNPLHRKIALGVAVVVWLGFTIVPVAVLVGVLR